jgi:glycosyltransferase involved in cell wall biosynthesis
LQQTLDSVVTQLQPGVDILISDNASTDGTAEIVQRYQADYPQIRYRRNPENVGAMKNNDMCVECALGMYVWLFGDDDKMTNGCIKKVLGVIKENSYQLGFISISADIYGKNWMLKDKNPLGLMDDIRFNNVGMLFSTLKDHIGLTPTIIVRRNLWVRYVNIRKLTDDYWFHVRMVLAIAEENDTYFIAAPPVMFNQSQVRWNRNGLFLQIVIDYCEMVLQLSDSKIGFRNKMEAIDRWYQSFWIHILVAKRNDWRLDISQVVRLIRVFKRFPRFWFFDLPLLFVPRVVVKFLFSIREKMLNISIRDA